MTLSFFIQYMIEEREGGPPREAFSILGPTRRGLGFWRQDQDLKAWRLKAEAQPTVRELPEAFLTEVTVVE